MIWICFILQSGYVTLIEKKASFVSYHKKGLLERGFIETHMVCKDIHLI